MYEVLLRKEGYHKKWDGTPVRVIITDELDWCVANIGKMGKRWNWCRTSDNAATFYFRRCEDAAIFKLQWA